MAEKTIQIKNNVGDILFPQTKGSVVFNNAGKDLGGVEENAQVNLIETVKVNGQALAIDGKAVDITIDAQAEYSIAKKGTAEEGYAASYYLTKDGAKVGEYINIPKDMVVESGELKKCVTKDVPVAGLEVGDPYIDLVLANADESHVYIPVKDLVDVYTQGNGIVITGHEIAIDDAVVVNHTEFATELAKKQDNLSEAQLAACDSGITEALVAKYDGYEATIAEKVVANEAITAGTKCKITYDAKGLVTAGADLVEADIPALHLAKVTDVTATAAELNILDGATVTAAELNVLDGIEATTAELNIMHGVTATTAELNILDGVTATAAELNVLDGIEASTVELNYVKGVTAGIQGQLDGKAEKATTLAGYGITDGLTYVELA